MGVHPYSSSLTRGRTLGSLPSSIAAPSANLMCVLLEYRGRVTLQTRLKHKVQGHKRANLGAKLPIWTRAHASEALLLHLASARLVCRARAARLPSAPPLTRAGVLTASPPAPTRVRNGLAPWRPGLICSGPRANRLLPSFAPWRGRSAPRLKASRLPHIFLCFLPSQSPPLLPTSTSRNGAKRV